MEEKGKTIVIEGNAKPGDPVLAPAELLELALCGADVFLENHPDLSPEMRASVMKTRENQRKAKEEQLKTVMRRYKVALNHAKVYQARYQDDGYVIQLDRKEPSVDEEGYVKLTAEDFDFHDARLLKAFAGASKINLHTEEEETQDGYEYRVALVMKFAV